MPIQLTVNGTSRSVDADPDMPLLWVLRDLLGLTGTKYGCGIAECGSCTVHVDGEATRSCVTSLGEVAGNQAAEILRAAGDDDGFALDAVIGHGR